MIYDLCLTGQKEYVDIFLSDILNSMNNEELYWSILYLEARGDIGDGKSILDLEKKINESEVGLQLKWFELIDLSKKFEEVIDIVLVGYSDPMLKLGFNNDEDMYSNCDIVVEMIDSSYWLIHAHKKRLIDELQYKFS